MLAAINRSLKNEKAKNIYFLHYNTFLMIRNMEVLVDEDFEFCGSQIFEFRQIN